MRLTAALLTRVTTYYCLLCISVSLPLPPMFVHALQDAFDSDPTIVDAAVADMLAVRDRDPACDKYSQCMLYFKGYQAIQCHRVAHWLWKQGRIVSVECWGKCGEEGAVLHLG